MQRYFIEPKQFSETSIQIFGDDAKHITKVMRSSIGDQFIVSDGQSREALVEITALDTGVVSALIIQDLIMENEPQVEVWIAQGLPKGDKMDTIIQKCTEIGAARFIPFSSERTIVQYDERKETKRIERWRKISKESAEQAHRNRVPQIDFPLSWSNLLKQCSEADLVLFCYEKDRVSVSLQNLLRNHGELQGKKVMIIIGPEGGFTEKEVIEAEAAGCKTISFGRRILRTETAALVGLTCILYETGEMEG